MQIYSKYERSEMSFSRDFSTFSKSRAIRKDFTHTCKNDKRARCNAVAQHDKE